ncbi:uncharacterized protein METZ01_LOCUS352670, partial [marine metagenome]
LFIRLFLISDEIEINFIAPTRYKQKEKIIG